MDTTSATERDKQMAQRCVDCPVFTHARKKQRGIAYWFVKTIEHSVCPYCAAYERGCILLASAPSAKEASRLMQPW